MARVHALLDVLVLHELRQEAPHESVAGPCLRHVHSVAISGPPEAWKDARAGGVVIFTHGQQARAKGEGRGENSPLQLYL